MSRARIWILGALIFGGALPARAQTAQWATGAYVYDGAGNIKSIGNTEQYRYDALGRLTSGTIATGQTQTVTYDPYGNIKTITTAGLALAVGVDPATNRATQTHEAQTNTAYNVYGTYDLAGRLTSALNGAGGTYSYDALDSVMKSTGNGVTKVHWYTASDERIASVAVVNNNGTWSDTESEWTLRDPSGKVLRRLQKTGTQWSWKEDYIYAGSQLLAAETDTPARTLHFFPDHLGTARLITANGGTKVSFHTYYPFGDEATASSQDSEKLKFTGHERDAANLDYMHARYYAPKWGRFLSPDPGRDWDPKHPRSWNMYNYVRNSPLNAVDPDGREVYLVSRKLDSALLSSGTHTILVVKPTGANAVAMASRTDRTGFGLIVLGGYLGDKSRGEKDGALVKRQNYPVDVGTATGTGRLKARDYITIQPPKGVSLEQFERNVVAAFDSYKETREYDANPDLGDNEGNCSTLSSGVLVKAGVRKEDLPKNLRGVDWGWPRPQPIP